MVGRVQERLRLQLEGSTGNGDQLLQQSYDFVAPSMIARVIFLSGLVPTDPTGEERPDSLPVTSRRAW